MDARPARMPRRLQYTKAIEKSSRSLTEGAREKVSLAHLARQSTAINGPRQPMANDLDHEYERAAQAEELRRRFGDEAAAAERQTLKSGKAYYAREVFSYSEARSRGNGSAVPVRSMSSRPCPQGRCKWHGVTTVTASVPDWRRSENQTGKKAFAFRRGR